VKEGEPSMERNAFISKIRDLQNQEKRSMEARIIQKSRENRTACVIDMDFNISRTWNCRSVDHEREKGRTDQGF